MGYLWYVEVVVYMRWKNCNPIEMGKFGCHWDVEVGMLLGWEGYDVTGIEVLCCFWDGRVGAWSVDIRLTGQLRAYTLVEYLKTPLLFI